MNDDEFDHMLRTEHDAFVREIESNLEPVGAPTPTPHKPSTNRRFLRALAMPLPMRMAMSLATFALAVFALAPAMMSPIHSGNPGTHTGKEWGNGGNTPYWNNVVAKEGSVTVSWPTPDRDTTGNKQVINYTVTADGVRSRTVTGTRTVFNNLIDGRVYRFKVTANLHDDSIEVPFMTHPGEAIIEEVVPRVVTPTTAHLSLLVKNFGGRRVLCQFFVSGHMVAEIAFQGSEASTTVMGLRPGTENEIVVKVKVDGMSEWLTTTVTTPQPR